MKFDEYAAQVSLGTLSPKSQEEWIDLIDNAVEPQLLSRLFADYFIRPSDQPNQPNQLSNNATTTASSTLWQKLLQGGVLLQQQLPTPSQVDAVVLHTLSNPSLDLSVLESMLGTGRLEDKHIGLLAFSYLVTPEVIEKWTFLYPSVLSCEEMQLKRAFAKHPQQVLHYGTKMLASVTAKGFAFSPSLTMEQSNKDYIYRGEIDTRHPYPYSVGNIFSWGASMGTDAKEKQEKKDKK